MYRATGPSEPRPDRCSERGAPSRCRFVPQAYSTRSRVAAPASETARHELATRGGPARQVCGPEAFKSVGRSNSDAHARSGQGRNDLASDPE